MAAFGLIEEFYCVYVCGQSLEYLTFTENISYYICQLYPSGTPMHRSPWRSPRDAAKEKSAIPTLETPKERFLGSIEETQLVREKQSCAKTLMLGHHTKGLAGHCAWGAEDFWMK